MFSITEFIFIAVVGVALGLFLRPRLISKQVQESAEQDKAAVRTPAQLRMHQGSIALLLPPYVYAFVVGGEFMWPILSTVMSHAGGMLLLRLIGLGYQTRLRLLPIVAVGAIVFGAIVNTWPSVTSASVTSAHWLLLVAASLFASGSTILSVLSFPLGYGERAK
jgi:hypothetical protein